MVFQFIRSAARLGSAGKFNERQCGSNMKGKRSCSLLSLLTLGPGALYLSLSCLQPSFAEDVAEVKVEAAQPELNHQNAKKKASVSTHEKQRSKRVNTASVKSSILINAPVEIVWMTVHEERQNAPDLAYSKVVQQGDNEMQIEQKFKFWSGGAKCLMNHKEIPNQRIDYQLIKSDHLKEMRGSWILSPCASGQETTLELSTIMDIGFVPRAIANPFLTKVIERRLAHIKQMAEQHREELEVKGHVVTLNASPQANHQVTSAP